MCAVNSPVKKAVFDNSSSPVISNHILGGTVVELNCKRLGRVGTLSHRPRILASGYVGWSRKRKEALSKTLAMNQVCVVISKLSK